MKLIKFLKTPGSIRIVSGGAVIILLLFFAVFGDFVCFYQSNEMDSDWIMEPPSSSLLRSFLVTEKGLKNLKRTTTPQVSHQGNDRDNSLDYLMEGLEEEFFNDSASESQSSISGGTTDNQQETDGEDEFSFLTNKNEKTKVPQEVIVTHNHFFGTDKDGRDIFSMLVAGAKTSLLPGLFACLVALGLGIPLGLVGGYYGGRWAELIRFINSLILSFPRFVLILVVICAIEPNVYYVMIVLGLTIVPRVSELIRTRVHTLSNMGFVLAAKESGLSDFKIMARHLFWYQNRTVFFIQASLIMAESILVETTLSYLQFGVKPPDISWGNIIEGSRLAFFSEYYWITFFPAVAIVISILGFFYLGDGLNARLAYRERR
ncbi:MAG: ABC transporter permease [Fibrobacteria bacterium]|nr:ABC transporter permease [Fibrobacteria bacterium]